jgi:hypothetical protein
MNRMELEYSTVKEEKSEIEEEKINLANYRTVQNYNGNERSNSLSKFNPGVKNVKQEDTGMIQINNYNTKK